MRDKMQFLLRLLGELEQHVDICLAGEDAVLRPGARPPIADEIRREQATVRRQRLDERKPFFVRGGAAMAEDDRRAFALIEISDLDALRFEAFHRSPGICGDSAERRRAPAPSCRADRRASTAFLASSALPGRAPTLQLPPPAQPSARPLPSAPPSAPSRRRAPRFGGCVRG